METVLEEAIQHFVPIDAEEREERKGAFVAVAQDDDADNAWAVEGESRNPVRKGTSGKITSSWSFIPLLFLSSFSPKIETQGIKSC